MCGGGGGGDQAEAREKADERHQENLALQREQMAEQKRQFELQRAENQKRYEKQQRIAEAAPPPPPEETAAVATPALDQLKISGSNRQKYRSPEYKKQTRNRSTSSLGIV